MSLVIQIILLVVVLAALVAIYLSTKNWHWSQVLFLTGILLASVGYLVLVTETMRIHRNFRAAIPKKEIQTEDFLQRNDALLHGSKDQAVINRLFAGDSPLDESATKMKGILDLEHRTQMATRTRGRVWRGVVPTGQVDNAGRVEVEIPNPQPHGLEADAIVFAFEAGNPNTANPSQGAQYLGEFRVVKADGQGALLEPVLLVIDRRPVQLLSNSQGPWNLYETMPADSHEMFSEFSEERLRSMLPQSSVEEYIRHGKEATDDDDDWHVAGYDELGRRIGSGRIAQAVSTLFDRPLRDYEFLFSEIARQRILMLADIDAEKEDNAKLETALESAEELTNFREKEIFTLTSDLEGMTQDRAAIEQHRDLVQQHLENAKQMVEQTLATNSNLARRLTERQLELLKQIDEKAPAPGTQPE